MASEVASAPAPTRVERREESASAHARDELLVRVLHTIIRGAVRALAIMMVIVIVWGVFDVARSLWHRATVQALLMPRLTDIVSTFGHFMAVLIAVEIFHNITSYLRTEAIQIRIVLATSLMAVARKIIVLDYATEPTASIFATAAVVLAIGIVYWLVARNARVIAVSHDESALPTSVAKATEGPPSDTLVRPMAHLRRVLRHSTALEEAPEPTRT